MGGDRGVVKRTISAYFSPTAAPLAHGQTVLITAVHRNSGDPHLIDAIEFEVDEPEPGRRTYERYVEALEREGWRPRLWAGLNNVEQRAWAEVEES